MDGTDSNQHFTLARQFTIKRLLWTLVVASVLFKMADLTGLIQFTSLSWESARTNQKIGIVISIVVFSVIMVGYIAWIGLRLPWLFESYMLIRKKRQRRREQFKSEYLAHQQRQSD